MLYNIAAALPLLTLAAAQYGYGSSDTETTAAAAAVASGTPVQSASGAVQTVKVGESGPSFSPNKLTAAVGDQIEFHFYPVTHSVAQASFDKPCEPSGDNAFFSGGITSGAASARKRQSGATGQVFTITVTDTKPIWFYCGFPGHCQKGMVGVINQAESGNKTIEAFAEAAAQVDTTVAPSKVQGGVLGMAKWDDATQTGTGQPATSSSAASGLMEKGSYGTVVAAGLVAGLAGIMGTLLI